MARKPERTDYVYTLISTDGWNHAPRAFRTLASAKAEATSSLSRPTVRKLQHNVWEVKSGVAPCATLITRQYLHN